MHSSTFSSTTALDDGGWLTPRSCRFIPDERLGGPQGQHGQMAKIQSHRDSILGPSNPQRVCTPATLLRSITKRQQLFKSKGKINLCEGKGKQVKLLLSTSRSHVRGLQVWLASVLVNLVTSGQLHAPAATPPGTDSGARLGGCRGRFQHFGKEKKLSCPCVTWLIIATVNNGVPLSQLATVFTK